MFHHSLDITGHTLVIFIMNLNHNVFNELFIEDFTRSLNRYLYLVSPDFTCSPSTFWLTTYWTTFSSTSLTKAMWVRDGLASSNVVSICGVIPFSSKVHTPFGPLKSGIPADVLTPAPVWNTMYLDSRTTLVNSAIFWSNCSGESKTYRIKTGKRIRNKKKCCLLLFKQ